MAGVVGASDSDHDEPKAEGEDFVDACEVSRASFSMCFCNGSSGIGLSGCEDEVSGTQWCCANCGCIMLNDRLAQDWKQIRTVSERAVSIIPHLALLLPDSIWQGPPTLLTRVSLFQPV